jgi:hypothetical protein
LDKGWPRLVKKVSADGFLDVSAQFVPSVTLCEDIVAETFSDEPSILFLVYAEDDFHALNFGTVVTARASDWSDSAMTVSRRMAVCRHSKESSERNPLCRKLVISATDSEA